MTVLQKTDITRNRALHTDPKITTVQQEEKLIFTLIFHYQY